MRGWAYLEDGRPEFALSDAKAAVAHGPRDAGSAPTPGADPGDEQGWSAATPWLAAALSSRWPAALVLLGAAYEAGGDNVRAALLFVLAAEKSGEGGDAGPSGEGLARLRARVPEEVAAALESGGSQALLRLLNRAHTAAQPEVLRQRPKYYYYYEWMKKRIAEQVRPGQGLGLWRSQPVGAGKHDRPSHPPWPPFPLEQYPALPEAVMDKLLTVEAGELDLVLQYPQATQQMVRPGACRPTLSQRASLLPTPCGRAVVPCMTGNAGVDRAPTPPPPASRRWTTC